MDRLRPRNRTIFTGFTTAEVEKMEKLLNELGEKCFNIEFFKKQARSFNSSGGRAGKPNLKWTEVQSWYQNKKLESPSGNNLLPCSTKLNPDVCPSKKANGNIPTSKEEEERNVPNLDFEAKSPQDGAWYDVEKFITYRTLRSGEIEARVRYLGFGPDEDEWLNVKECIRERSIGIDHTECQSLKPGNLVVCFLEKDDAAKFYDAHVVDIQRKMHDARGCRCVFIIRYNHNNVEETVDLNRLYRRPDIQRPHQIVA